MEIIKVKDSFLEEYESLLLRKDEVIKEANLWYGQYMNVFGDLIVKSFEIKVECIKLKKMINYCTVKNNKNEKINYNDMETFINIVMVEYNKQLDNLIIDNKMSKKMKPIRDDEAVKIKKIYYRIAKKIHPDMHPELMNDEKIKELWNRVVVAYTCNNLEDIEELEVLLNKLLANQEETFDIPDIQEKIKKIGKEIVDIMNSYPYLYKDLLLDYDLTVEKKKELDDEYKNYELYKQELEKVFNEFEIEVMVS